jgi:glycosyltransferase involved in cell wall biosynthesis
MTTPSHFSIVIAAFNAEDTLAQAIDSLIGQTMRDWDAIVVDDGSDDRTQAIAASAAAGDSRIRVVSQPNTGTAAARNAGAAETSGDWLLFVDADDLLYSDYLERMSDFMSRHPGYDVYSCNVDVLLPDGRTRPMWSGARFREPFSVTAVDQILESSIVLMSPVKRTVWARLGGFRDLHSEDYDFWLRALLGGARHIFNPDTLAAYRRRPGSKTRSLVSEAESFLWILRDNSTAPDLSPAEKDAFARAIAFAVARVERRTLEEGLLSGNLADARRLYRLSSAAFPNRPQYWLGLAIMLVSPALYARIKARRMF